MKKFLLLSLSVITLSSAGFAQAKQNNKPMEVQGIPVEVYAKSLTDQMTQQYKLTPAQSTKMMEANRNIAIKWSKLEQNNTDRAHVKATETEINNYKMQEYRQVLTKAQYEQWSHGGTDATTR
jgi:hypothetical protein